MSMMSTGFSKTSFDINEKQEDGTERIAQI